MTTNPYAYYEDEPFPDAAPLLNVGDDGEPEPDMEPRFPILLKVKYIVMWQLALKTCELKVGLRMLRVPCPRVGGEIEISREESVERVNVRGNKITLQDEIGKKHRYLINASNSGETALNIARLQTWCEMIADPETAYETVKQRLFRRILNGCIPMMIGSMLFSLLNFLVLGRVMFDISNGSLMPTGLLLFAVRSVAILSCLLYFILCATESPLTKFVLLGVGCLHLFALVLGVVFLFFSVSDLFSGVIVWDGLLVGVALGGYFVVRRAEYNLKLQNGKV